MVVVVVKTHNSPMVENMHNNSVVVVVKTHDSSPMENILAAVVVVVVVVVDACSAGVSLRHLFSKSPFYKYYRISSLPSVLTFCFL